MSAKLVSVFNFQSQHTYSYLCRC